MEFKDINLLDFGTKLQMAGVVYSDAESNYVIFFPDMCKCQEVNFLEPSLKEWESLLRQTDILEVEILKQGAEGIVKAVIRKTQRQIDSRVTWQVYKRDNYSCRYCGNDGIPLTMDHVYPWELGGVTEINNLVSCCRKCNAKKANMLIEEWLKDPYYLKVSKNLTWITRQANEDMVQSTQNIDKRITKRGR